MGAAFRDATERAVLTAVHDEILAHHLDALLRMLVREIARRPQRLPVAAQQLTAGRIGAGLGQARVLFR